MARLAGMSVLAALLGPIRPLSGQGVPVSEACTACHITLQDQDLRRPAELFPQDVHAKAGFGCLDCHGNPDRTGAPDPSGGFLRAPERSEIPALCGRCHSNPQLMRDYDPSLRVDQVTEYYTSVHGRRLSELDDPNVATCVSCHPAHDIKPPSDPESSVYPLNVARTCGRCHGDADYMAGYDVPTTQLEEYQASVHGKMMFEEGDLSAPTCNDCHGNHGAAPPGIGSVRNVCGQCHATMAQLFTENGHDQYFVEAGLSGCDACHGHHDVTLPDDRDLLDKNREVCRSCHPLGSGRDFELPAMAYLIDSLKADRQRADSILERAENLGMEVSQARFELEDAATSLTKARTAIHSFTMEPVEEAVDGGLEITGAAAARGREALDEHRFRRMGLAGSVTMIAVLILGLALKIREIESATTSGGPDGREERASRHP